MNKNPILIGGCPRSGTTALLQLLNSNDQFYISSEENLLTKFDELTTLLSTREKRIRKMQGKIRELSERESLTPENLHSHNFSRTSVWPTLRYIYKHHHNKLKTTSELKVWGDKLPNYYKDISKKIDEPWVQYIHITRNPFDVINSMLRRVDKARQGKDWWRAITEVNDMIDAWSEAYDTIRSIKEKENVLEIHYEELVFDTKNCIKEINQFVDIDASYDPILISDATKHYDRSYISPDVKKALLNNDSVQHYIETFKKGSQYRNVAESVALIELK